MSALESFLSGDQTDAFGMFGIKVPLYYSTKQRYGEKEALAKLEGARKNYDAVLQDALFRMKDNFVRVQRAARLVKLIGGAIIPQASLALEWESRFSNHARQCTQPATRRVGPAPPNNRSRNCRRQD